ncbi:MAG: hypothetical protein WC322_07105 [Candidatus Paceibacterota bacterium]
MQLSLAMVETKEKAAWARLCIRNSWRCGDDVGMADSRPCHYTWHGIQVKTRDRNECSKLEFERN